MAARATRAMFSGGGGGGIHCLTLAALDTAVGGFDGALAEGGAAGFVGALLGAFVEARVSTQTSALAWTLGLAGF